MREGFLLRISWRGLGFEDVVEGVALGADGKDKGIVDDAELVEESTTQEYVELPDAEESDCMDGRELAELSSIEEVVNAE